MNENMYNVSSSPHFRQKLTTGDVMLNVIIALMPATLVGVIHYGLHAFLIIAFSILSCMLSEFVFDYITKRPNTLQDKSAIVTGLLLALSLSPTVPLYIPVFGGMFAILIAKCFFGGLGKNFMNPALAARCFLLISFGTEMTAYTTDAVSSATPLAALQAGETVNIARVYLGLSNGVIGCSALALLIGGLYLWVTDGITWHIPVSCLVAFTAFIALFGGRGFDIPYLTANIVGGGILMGAFFMATDPVTSPVTTRSQVLFGIIVGILAALFRVKGSSADSVSYSIVIANMLVPFLDKLPVPRPLGYEKSPSGPREFPKAAINLFVITLIAGLALSGVYALTKQKIADQQLQANAASYQEVLPDATEFGSDDAINSAIEALGGEAYDTASYGKTYVNSVVVGKDDSGSVIGYVISVTSGDGFDGDITLSVGLSTDGTVQGIAFTELNETAGMGMRADEAEFKDQFAGVQTDAFTLNKSGNATADDEINTISGASTTSGAVVNAVNTALAFYRDHIA